MQPADYRIVLLCQDPTLLESMRGHLTRLGFPVRALAVAQGLLACDREWQPHLLICDYDLPEGAINELVLALHRQNASLRFIILTPSGRTLEIMRAMRNRVAAFLSRPFSLEDLTYYVMNVLQAHDTDRNRREHNRYTFTVETHCIVINPFVETENRPIPALMRDVSRAGASIIVRQLVPVPSMLKLVVHLNESARPITLLAKSLSCMLTQIPGVFRVGAKFVGLLPREMAEAMLPVGQAPAGLSPDEDIYMGKSFKEAVRDWLNLHQHEEMVRQPGRQLAELAAEMSSAESEHEASTNAGRGLRPPVVPRADLLPLDLYLKNFTLNDPSAARSTQPALSGSRPMGGLPPKHPLLDETAE